MINNNFHHIIIFHIIIFPQSLLTAEAIWDHVAILPDELPFASGDSITILDYSSHPELWYGSCGESTGWFPSSYVRVYFRLKIFTLIKYYLTHAARYLLIKIY